MNIESYAEMLLRDGAASEDPILRACFLFAAANFYNFQIQSNRSGNDRNVRALEQKIDHCLDICSDLIQGNEESLQDIILPSFEFSKTIPRAGVRAGSETESIFRAEIPTEEEKRQTQQRIRRRLE